MMSQPFSLLLFVLLGVDPAKFQDVLFLSTGASKQQIIVHHVNESLLLLGVRLCLKPFFSVLEVSVKDYA